MNESEVAYLSLWVQIVSAAVALLVFLIGIYQLYKVVQSIKSQTYQNIYELMISIDKFFIENPKFREIVYGPPPGEEPRFGKQSLYSEVDGMSVASVAEMVIDYFDNVYHQRKVMPSETFEPFSKFMRHAYSESPVLQRFLEDNWRWYPPKFRCHLEGRNDCE